MYSGLAIADYFIKKCLEKNIPITNMAVLKMIYFAHGFCYALKNLKLIDDSFYAWPWGPVERKTYDEFKIYGSKPISSVSGKTNDILFKIENSPEIVSFLDRLIPLAKADPFVLSKKSHVAGGPWDVTPMFQKIDDKIIQVYFNARYGGKQ